MKEYLIYENWNKGKVVGKVILTKEFDWGEVAITEALIGDYKKGEDGKLKFVNAELREFSIVPRDSRVNRVEDK